MVLDALFSVGHRRRLALADHTNTALAIAQGGRTSRDALDALMVINALFGVGPRRR